VNVAPFFHFELNPSSEWKMAPLSLRFKRRHFAKKPSLPLLFKLGMLKAAASTPLQALNAKSHRINSFSSSECKKPSTPWR
jgi:hypothetical protein